MFSSVLFVSRFGELHKNYSTDFHKIWWKSGHGPWKKRLDSGGNPCLNPDPGIFLQNYYI